MSIYTDLALEAAEFSGLSGGTDGVRSHVEEVQIPGGAVKITRIEIYNENGAKALGKPIGRYITVESEVLKGNDIAAHEEIIKIIAALLADLVPEGEGSVLLTGLGNRNVTPDALGPRVAGKVLVTRHIGEALPDGLMGAVRSVACITPGVMGATGIETGEIVKAVVESVKPGLVIVVDALAARRASRVNATIQLADSGLSPGSGMGNTRMALTPENLGVPVIALGVPTVVDAATLVNDTLDIMLEHMTTAVPEGSDFYETLRGLAEEEKYAMIKQTLDPYVGNMFVTPKEVDAVIDRLSNIIANAVNIALHPGITKDDINRYMY